MRLLLALPFLLHSFTQMSAQRYKEMMEDPSINFYTVVAEAEAYFENNDKGKGSGYTPYMRWKVANEPIYYPNGDRTTINLRKTYAAAQKIRRQSASQKSMSQASWSELGPASLDSITAHYSPGLGRIEEVWADSYGGDTLYCSSRSGGWWRSYDGGNSWENTTDTLPVTGVNAFSVNPENSLEIVINVRNAINGYTHGVYKSNDGGTSWQMTAFNPGTTALGGFGNNATVYDIRHNTTHPDTIYIATSQGLWRSVDGLTSVNNVYNESINSVLSHPTNPDIVYLARRSSGQRDNIYRSTDGGGTWSVTETLTNNNDSRLTLHTVKSHPDLLVASSGTGVFFSEKDAQNFFFINSGVSGSTFAISDTDPSVMLRGVLDIYRSDNYGSTWTQATEWYLPGASNTNYVHADFRCSYSVNGTIYAGTDGFMVKTADGGVSWGILTNDNGIREYYKLGQSQSHRDVVSVGSQDNGSSYYREGTWYEWVGADGMEQIVHPCNPDWAVGSIQYGNKRRTKNGAQSHTGINSHESLNLYWIAPLAYDPLDAGTIYSLGNKLVRSDDWGDNWTTLHDFGVTCNRLAIAENDNQLMIATDREDIYKSMDGGSSFTQIGTSLPNFFIADIAFDPQDDQTFVVLYDQWQDNNQRVFITHDAGSTFQNISHNLSPLPGRSVVIDHSASHNIYVGTEAGVYVMPMGGTTYAALYDNLPPVGVRELEIHYGSNTLRAATWGRGLWQAPLLGRKGYPQIVSVDSDNNLAEPVNQGPRITATVDNGDAIESLLIEYSTNSLSLDQEVDLIRVAENTYYATAALPATTTGDRVYYRLRAISATGDTTTTYRYNYEVDLTADYCSAAGSGNTGSDYIVEVTVNGTTNSSGKNAYTNYGNVNFSADQYDSVRVDVRLNAVFAPDLAGAWIDWNNDKFFSEEEAIAMGPYVNQIASGQATLPPYVDPGQYRLRVRNSYDTAVQPCGDAAGEVEDYLITVAASCPDPAYVTNTSDGLPGSLRYMVDRMCSGDTIFFAPELVGDSIVLYNAPISNDVEVTIFGNVTTSMTISGDTVRQIFNVVEKLNLVNLNLVDGLAPTDGGALINNDTLTLRNVVFENHKEGIVGKALTNYGTIRILPGMTVIKE